MNPLGHPKDITASAMRKLFTMLGAELSNHSTPSRRNNLG